MDFVDFLVEMIHKENNMANGYREWGNKCSDPNYKSVLCDIAEQREKHQVILINALGTMARKVLKKG